VTKRAIKIAGHELKSLNCIFDCKHERVFPPLMVVIDYRGYRVVAGLILPLKMENGKGRMIMGSADAGKTICIQPAHDPNMIAIKEVCEMLNLKPHVVTSTGEDPGSNTLVYGPVDLEGHLGLNDRFHLLDFSRLFPVCSKDQPTRYLYEELFRPEFVRLHDRPLSSDGGCLAFRDRTVMFRTNPDNTEVFQATTQLENCLEGFVKSFLLDNYLNKESPEMSNANHSVMAERLIREMHFSGINLRYLPRIYALMLQETMATLLLECHRADSSLEQQGETGAQCLTFWRSVVLVEIVARRFKRYFRKQLRERVPRSCSSKRYIVDLLNETFRAIPDPNGPWYTIFNADEWLIQMGDDREALRRIFFGGSDLPLRCRLFQRLATMLGIRLHEPFHEQFATSESPYKKNLEVPFALAYVEDIRSVVTQLTFIHRIRSELFEAQIEAQQFQEPSGTLALLTLSHRYLEESISRSSSNPAILKKLAQLKTKILFFEGVKKRPSVSERTTMTQEIIQNYMKAYSLKQNKESISNEILHFVKQAEERDPEALNGAIPPSKRWFFKRDTDKEE